MHDIRFRLLEEVLVINLGDTKILGHPISQSIVVRADEVIELPLVMLWTAPPPARECHGCGRC
jgi:hypothetical protein